MHRLLQKITAAANDDEEAAATLAFEYYFCRRYAHLPTTKIIKVRMCYNQAEVEIMQIEQIIRRGFTVLVRIPIFIT